MRRAFLRPLQAEYWKEYPEGAPWPKVCTPWGGGGGALWFPCVYGLLLILGIPVGGCQSCSCSDSVIVPYQVEAAAAAVDEGEVGRSCRIAAVVVAAAVPVYASAHKSCSTQLML